MPYIGAFFQNGFLEVPLNQYFQFNANIKETKKRPKFRTLSAISKVTLTQVCMFVFVGFGDNAVNTVLSNLEIFVRV